MAKIVPCIGHDVKLDLDRTGTVIKIRDYVWGFNYDVRIKDDGIFNKAGDIEDFRLQDLQLIATEYE